ncbi:hypothetical protein FBU30_001841 [Linnemannia zychae]|nr:hypothetical protein FBU30_001841 [Linnemannia zychae]
MHGQRSQVEQPQQEQEHKQKQLEQAQEQQKQQQQQQKEDDDKEKQHQEDENEQKLQKQRQQQRLQGKQKHLSVPMLPIIPGRSSSLHAYSTNDAHGTKSGIELASWNESPQSLYNSPLLIENIGDDSSHNGDDNGDDTISTNANPATSLTADSAARHYNSPGMIAKRLRTRTTTIVKTTSDPVITIKLIHTPSDQSISSLVSGYSTSGSNSGGESCGEIEEMINTAVALESHYDRFCHYDRFYGLDYSGLFADFDSVSPRIDEEDEDEVDDDKEDDGRHGDDRGTDDEDYDGDEGQEDGDEDENHTSGSNSRNYRSHTMEDFGFGRLPSPSSSNNHRSNTTAAPHTRGLLPQRHITNAAASVVSADASTFGSSTFTRPSTITFGKDARPMKFATTPKLSRYNRNQSSSSFSKELEHENESVGWIDHFLALNSTYRDHLATLNLQLCRALHYHLLQHTRGLIDLQKHILGVSGIGNEKLTSSFLADMVFEKLRPRMEKDLRDQSQVCWAIGELIQQGLGQTLLTLDYEEEDAFEGVRKRIRTQRSKDEGVLVVDDESEEDMDSDDGDGDDEENGENFGLPRWMKTVRKELQEAFPMDDQYPLFKWSFLQSPYATLKDLNIAREALMSLSRSSSIKHEQDSETTSVNERLDSASGQDTIGPFEIEMEMKREQGGRPMLKDEDWKFKGSNPLISFEAAPGQSFRSPSYHCPGNDDKKSFLSSNDSSSVFLSSLPAPPVATGLQTTGSFSTQDSMRTDHFHVDPDSFADRPEVPTQPVVDTNTAEPNFGDDSSIDNPRGLDSSPEWVRIVRALTESDAASPAPNPRLPIWVVYAPQIPSSSTLPFLPLAADINAFNMFVCIIS